MDELMLQCCPYCNSDLKGAPIPEEHFIHQGDCPLPEGTKDFPGKCFCLPYGDLQPEDRFFSRRIGHEIWGVYDGVLFWECPDCYHRWPRFNKGFYHTKAQEIIELDKQ